jgi:D-alanyl-D-alanine carboxypeptidase
MMRGSSIALLLVLLACADEPTFSGGTSGAGAAGVGGGFGGVGAGGDVTVEEDPYDPPPTLPPLSDEAVAGIAAEIDGILAPFGAQMHSVLVVGLDTGQSIYERDADQLLKPASNTKLFASAASMAALGDAHRHESVVYATASASGGVINGDLVIVGDHDFTWSTYFYPQARLPLDWIAARLAQQGITEVTGAVRASGEFLFDGYNFGTYSSSAHRATVAIQFDNALNAAGISTGATSTSPDFTPPAGSVELARWASLPSSVGQSPLNRISHNEFADILSRHVGWAQAQDSTYAGGEAEVLALLAEEPALDLNGVTFNNGSGLSHDNRVSARHVVGLFELMENKPEGLAWRRTFAVAGVHGTIAGRMGGANTLGRFRGKTGTLNGVIALGGILQHRYDGQRYALSMLMNNVTSNSAARAAHDAMVGTVAEDLRDLGARPDAPTLASVRNSDDGKSVTATWSDVAGADGYLVWRSRDGKLWPRQEARLVHTTTHKTLAFDDSPTLYIRVSTIGAAGESVSSDTYAASSSATPILLVDGNDIWQAQPAPENPVAKPHDFMARYAESLSRGFDSCDNDAVLDGQCPLEDYTAVIWTLGEESSDHETFSDAEQSIVQQYIALGSAFITSGAELGWDLGNANGSPTDTLFLNETLGVSYEGDDAGTFMLDRGDAQPLSFLTPGRMVVDYADFFTGDDVLGQYFGAASSAIVGHADRVVVAGFPIESIDNADDRRVLLEELLNYVAE